MRPFAKFLWTLVIIIIALMIVPVFVVQELSHEFERRLSAVDLTGWHVYIVDENNRLLVDWRPVVSAPTLVHLRHYQVLHHHRQLQHQISTRRRLRVSAAQNKAC